MLDLPRRLDALMGKHAPALAATLRPPASETHMLAVEQELGFRLPEDVREAYLWHDGQTTHFQDELPPFFFGDRAWNDLEHLLRCWRLNMGVMRSAPEESIQPDDTVSANQQVRFDWWSARFIPIGGPRYAALLCVDMQPGPAGHEGQLIAWYGDGMEHQVVAPSLHTHLQVLADCLESGEIKFSSEMNGWVHADTGVPIADGGRWLPDRFFDPTEER